MGDELEKLGPDATDEMRAAVPLVIEESSVDGTLYCCNGDSVGYGTPAKLLYWHPRLRGYYCDDSHASASTPDDPPYEVCATLAEVLK